MHTKAWHGIFQTCSQEAQNKMTYLEDVIYHTPSHIPHVLKLEALKIAQFVS